MERSRQPVGGTPGRRRAQAHGTRAHGAGGARLVVALVVAAAVVAGPLPGAQAEGPSDPVIPVADFRARLANREVVVEWTATPGLAEFALIRSLASGAERDTLATFSGNGAFVHVDATVSPGTRYLYELRARDCLDREVLHAPVAVETDLWVPGSLAARGGNPFRTETSFSFSLEAPGRAIVTVHDVRGRRVRRLRSGTSAAGDYTLSWDGRDDAGRAVSGGVYLLRLETETDIQTRRLVFLGR